MKKLVFYFYICENWATNKANLVHFMCLKRYNEIFNEVEIYIATDDKQDYETINNVKLKFLSIFTKVESIQFTIIDNTVYREAIVLKQHVIDRLGQDDLVFFGHNKGTTDIVNHDYNPEYVIKWIVGLYFFSLEYICEVDACLYNSPFGMSYGPFLTLLKTPEGMELKHLGKYKWYYVGTFYWINSKKLYNFIKRFNIEIPPLDDRFYAENILANFYPLLYEGQVIYAGSHDKRYIVKYDDSFLDIETALYVLYPGGNQEFEEYLQEIYNSVCLE